MSVRSLFLCALLACFLGEPVFAESLEQPEGTDSRESIQKAIAATKDGRELARLHKQLGDLYASREEYGKAADEFRQALSLTPSVFSEQERLGMAITVSWTSRYDDAAGILRAVLAENPKNRDARIHLAKVLSWSSKLNEAESEADTVLNMYPENQDALLVKANALRWRGDAGASIPVYEKALAQGENFDARIGLAYAYLDTGEKEIAKETSAPLKPLYPYQEKELARFSDSLCGVRANRGGVRYSYYKDSEDNRINRYTLLAGFWSGQWNSEVTYRVTDATDPVQQERAEDFGIVTNRRFGRIDTGAGVGVNSANGVGIVTALARADAETWWGAVGVSAARDALTDTAELIRNRIARSSGTVSVTERTSARLTFNERYSYAGYSDGNSSDDLWLSVKYAVTVAPPKLAVGYRFRYLDFRRQSGGGYFDPENFVSHEVFATLFAEKGAYYASLEPYGGYQSYLRNGERTDSMFFGFTGVAGWTIQKCTAFEVFAEGSNYAGTVAGFNHVMAGFRLTGYF